MSFLKRILGLSASHRDALSREMLTFHRDCWQNLQEAERQELKYKVATWVFLSGAICHEGKKLKMGADDFVAVALQLCGAVGVPPELMESLIQGTYFEINSLPVAMGVFNEGGKLFAPPQWKSYVATGDARKAMFTVMLGVDCIRNAPGGPVIFPRSFGELNLLLKYARDERVNR